MKLPLTIRLEYSSRKKKGGLRDPETGPSWVVWLSRDMLDDSAGEWGMGGRFGVCCPGAADGEYGPLVVGDGVPFPPFPCWLLLLLERPARPWRLIEGQNRDVREQVWGGGNSGNVEGSGRRGR